MLIFSENNNGFGNEIHCKRHAFYMVLLSEKRNENALGNVWTTAKNPTNLVRVSCDISMSLSTIYIVDYSNFNNKIMNIICGIIFPFALNVSINLLISTRVL